MVVAINTIALHSCYIKLHCQLTSSLHNKRTSMPQIVCGVPMIIRIIRTIVPSTITLHPYKIAKRFSGPHNTVALKVTRAIKT